jgi:hypothetical protein
MGDPFLSVVDELYAVLHDGARYLSRTRVWFTGSGANMAQ